MARAYNIRQIQSICERAGALGRQRGWCQRAFVAKDGSMCLVALINNILGHKPSDELPMSIKKALHRHLMATRPTYRRHVHSIERVSSFRLTNKTLFTWNDLGDTTAYDVLVALEEIGRGEWPGDRTWDRALRRISVKSTQPAVKDPVSV